MSACRFSVLTAVVSAALFASPLHAQTATNSTETPYFQSNGLSDSSDAAQANGPGDVAVGPNARANSADLSAATAIGSEASAQGGSTLAVGMQSSAEGTYSSAVGAQARATQGGQAFGAGSKATGYVSAAVGQGAQATGTAGTAVGNNAQAQQDYATALGSATVAGTNATAVGTFASAEGNLSSALGYGAKASQVRSVAMGYGAEASAQGCVALGSLSRCLASDEVSVGSTYEGGSQSTRRVTNLRAGTSDTDAANLGQVRTAVQSLGGGATFVNGNFVAPIYQFRSGATHQTVGAALDDLDGRVTAVEQTPGSGSGIPGPRGADGLSAYEVALTNGFQGNESDWLASLKGESGAQGPAGNDGVDGTAGTSSSSVAKAGKNVEVTTNADGSQTVSVSDNVQLSDAGSVSVGATTVNAQGVSIQGGASVTTAGINAGNQRVSNVQAGRVERGSTDAVNGGQLWDAQQAWNDRWTDTDRRVRHQDRRINALGAQLGALSQMATAAAANGGGAVGQVNLNMGVGFSGGEAAVSIGWGARISERTSVSAGLSFGSGNKPVAGFGVSINLGR
ncbi:YadA-like family protein [Xanthomonas arboricola]|uniref:Adhesin n=2 Tax=Xanthomonas arboricola TaxID=56448 RepID=A0ABM8SJL1_9XANT|nr:YadA-like family protein [Xanthomonas arboricola]UQQ11868.1 YadA-like family protein [Xanthomonas arboricola pv. corylina]CAE6814528.1 hypothetical protein XAC301_32140 [Xanthomonas arboricola pv. corylina]CAE6814548.1 hypothetical protein XAC301_32140 [Xanthomonas arboricola pv. corylina]CAE6815657.1 hypothetical protein CFBP6600_32080 [Xanthomonas arboricola pv. corylina]CAE6815685.1 hypothetical protein CFBP6600_32080 [Xanthomonas arboricola pv. corylina]